MAAGLTPAWVSYPPGLDVLSCSCKQEQVSVTFPHGGKSSAWWHDLSVEINSLWERVKKPNHASDWTCSLERLPLIMGEGKIHVIKHLAWSEDTLQSILILDFTLASLKQAHSWMTGNRSLSCTQLYRPQSLNLYLNRFLNHSVLNNSINCVEKPAWTI